MRAQNAESREISVSGVNWSARVCVCVYCFCTKSNESVYGVPAMNPFDLEQLHTSCRMEKLPLALHLGDRALDRFFHFQIGKMSCCCRPCFTTTLRVAVAGTSFPRSQGTVTCHQGPAGVIKLVTCQRMDWFHVNALRNTRAHKAGSLPWLPRSCADEFFY